MARAESTEQANKHTNKLLNIKKKTVIDWFRQKINKSYVPVNSECLDITEIFEVNE